MKFSEDDVFRAYRQGYLDNGKSFVSIITAGKRSDEELTKTTEILLGPAANEAGHSYITVLQNHAVEQKKDA